MGEPGKCDLIFAPFLFLCVNPGKNTNQALRNNKTSNKQQLNYLQQEIERGLQEFFQFKATVKCSLMTYIKHQTRVFIL